MSNITVVRHLVFLIFKIFKFEVITLRLRAQNFAKIEQTAVEL